MKLRRPWFDAHILFSLSFSLLSFFVLSRLLARQPTIGRTASQNFLGAFRSHQKCPRTSQAAVHADERMDEVDFLLIICH